MANGTTTVHLTHEAVEKVGGIGAVLQGFFTSQSYLNLVDRSILVGPLFNLEGGIHDRLGPDGEVLYSSIDGLTDTGYGSAFRKIEEHFNCGIVYGRRTFIDSRTQIKSSPEVLLFDVRHMNKQVVNRFKSQLFEEFGIQSHMYETLWEYEQYVRLAPVAIAALKAIGTAQEQYNIALKNANTDKLIDSNLGQMILDGTLQEEIWEKNVEKAREVQNSKLLMQESMGEMIKEWMKNKPNLAENIIETIDELPTWAKIVGAILAVLLLKNNPKLFGKNGPGLTGLLTTLGVGGFLGHLGIKAATDGEKGIFDVIQDGVDKLKDTKDQIRWLQNVEYRNVLLKLLEKQPDNDKSIIALTIVSGDKITDLVGEHTERKTDGTVVVKESYYQAVLWRSFKDKDGNERYSRDYFDKMGITREDFNKAIQIYLMQISGGSAAKGHDYISNKLDSNNEETYDPTWTDYAILDVGFNSIRTELKKAQAITAAKKQAKEEAVNKNIDNQEISLKQTNLSKIDREKDVYKKEFETDDDFTLTIIETKAGFNRENVLVNLPEAISTVIEKDPQCVWFRYERDKGITKYVTKNSDISFLEWQQNLIELRALRTSFNFTDFPKLEFFNTKSIEKPTRTKIDNIKNWIATINNKNYYKVEKGKLIETEKDSEPFSENIEEEKEDSDIKEFLDEYEIYPSSKSE